jgi:flagellin
MSRINTNTASIIAGRELGRSNDRLLTSLERLSSGLRINRGADDPAGLIISQNLRSEIESVNQAVSNSQRASNVIATTEGALNEVAALLNDIQSKIVESANSGAISDDEIKANQGQINDAIDAITRIANTSTFAGRKLLDGSLGYVTSGVQATNITDLRINRVQFGTASYIPVTVAVTQSAQHAQLEFRTSAITSDVTLELSGPDGVYTIPLTGGTTASAIGAAINQVSDATGITASLINPFNAGSGIVLNSEAYGTDAFVAVKEIGGPGTVFDTVDSLGQQVKRDTGRDVIATVNGATALGKGLEVSLNSSSLSLEFLVQEAVNYAGNTSFAITGGGALFQLGPRVDSNQQVNIGVDSIAASNLGKGSIGYLSEITSGGQYSLVSGNAKQASEIISEAINQISGLRGRLGAFEKNTLDTNVNQLRITLENLTSAESSIRDLDFAQETSNLTRNQILVSAGTSVLRVANQMPQSVLALLQ